MKVQHDTWYQCTDTVIVHIKYYNEEEDTWEGNLYSRGAYQDLPVNLQWFDDGVVTDPKYDAYNLGVIVDNPFRGGW